MADQMRIPVRVGNRVEYVRVSAEAQALEAARAQEERERVAQVLRCRSYFEGTQFDQENQDARDAYQRGEHRHRRLPEHKRLHAYSTQIEDCVRYVSNRISTDLVVAADDEKVQEVLDLMTEHSPQLWTYNEAGEREFTTLEALRDALVAMDVAVHLRWDPVQECVYAELWESEYVQVVQETMLGPDKVILSQDEWRTLEDGTQRVEKHTLTWEYVDVVTDDGIARDVQVTEEWEKDEKPVDQYRLGLGRIPWVLLRGQTKGIRAVRGSSLISEQAMETADRYNAVEQVGYLIARYNSHANIAVVGDAALLKVESEGKVNKDVADVLTFPGGTNLQVLSLPTDPQMIEHQRNVLSEALYNKFGVTRLDAESLEGMGALSGYALEILNQKSQATFEAITNQWRRDLASMFDLVLDIYAWRTEAKDVIVSADGTTRSVRTDEDDDTVLALEDGETVQTKWWDVDVAAVFPNRKISIKMGSGYIVDDVKVRDDFVHGMISRREALRKRGYGETQIDTIIEEITAEKEQAAALMLAPMGGEGTASTAGRRSTERG